MRRFAQDIKFRAWDDIYNKMYRVADISWLEEKIDVYDGLPELGKYHPIDFIDTSVMQFTGIKDIHDVEIYEGDILTNSWADILTVEYHGCQWQAKLIKRNTSEWTAQYLHCEYMGWIVIGNIYENPELLEVNK